MQPVTRLPGPYWQLDDDHARPPRVRRVFLQGECQDLGHVVDQVYGPRECARCGARRGRVARWHWRE